MGLASHGGSGREEQKKTNKKEKKEKRTLVPLRGLAFHGGSGRGEDRLAAWIEILGTCEGGFRVQDQL